MVKCIIFLLSLSVISCSFSPDIIQPKNTSITVSDYGTLSSGELIKQYELITNSIRVKVINYGGIITNIEVPDRNGIWQDVVLGYDNLADYEHKNRFFGALVGRYANRIENGMATINDKTIQLNINRPPHQLHGGLKGFDKKVWQAETEKKNHSVALHLRLISPDGDEGYPGELHAKVSYIVTQDGKLIVEYRAKTDKDTLFNPTQHSYFNLSGNGNTDILDHQLTLNAKTMVELNSESIPTGKFINVTNTPFDFQQAKTVGQDILKNHKQLQIGKGYDHYFLAKNKRGELTDIAHLYHQKTGRSLKISTTEQGAQLYSANYLNNSVIGKNNIPSKPHQGLCIETSQLPNAPAQTLFETYVLSPSTPFYSATVFAFSAD